MLILLGLCMWDSSENFISTYRYATHISTKASKE